MKKTLIFLLLFTLAAFTLSAQIPTPTARQLKGLGLQDATLTAVRDGIWQARKGGRKAGYVVNSAAFAGSVRGFRGPTPVLVAVDESGRIAHIYTLPNQETPDFFSQAASVLRRWRGLKAKAGAALQPDAVSGATYSSSALIANVRAALEAYGEYCK